MKIIFDNFAVDIDPLPEGDIRVKFVEAIEGEGPDGATGAVASGNEFVTKMNNDVGRGLAIEFAIATGMIKDLDKPEIATLADLQAEIAERRIKKSRGQ